MPVSAIFLMPSVSYRSGSSEAVFGDLSNDRGAPAERLEMAHANMVRPWSDV